MAYGFTARMLQHGVWRNKHITIYILSRSGVNKFMLKFMRNYCLQWVLACVENEYIDANLKTFVKNK